MLFVGCIIVGAVSAPDSSFQQRGVLYNLLYFTYQTRPSAWQELMARASWPWPCDQGLMAMASWPGTHGQGLMAKDSWPGPHGQGPMAKDSWPAPHGQGLMTRAMPHGQTHDFVWSLSLLPSCCLLFFPQEGTQPIDQRTAGITVEGGPATVPTDTEQKTPTSCARARACPLMNS